MSRLLLITNLYPPLMRGGAERLAHAQAEALARLGHEVHVLTTNSATPPLPNACHCERERSNLRGPICGDCHVMSNVESTSLTMMSPVVHRYTPNLPYHLLEDTDQPFWKRLWWHAKDLWPTTGAEVAGDIIAQVKPDQIILHNMRGMGLGVWRTALRSGIPTTQIWHDVQGVVPSGLWWLARHRPVWQWAPIRFAYSKWLQWVGGRASCMVFPSRALQKMYERHGWMNQCVQTMQSINPAIPAVFPPMGERVLSEGIVQTMDRTMDTRQPIYGFIGQITEGKGADLLVRAVAQQSAACELWMVGDGPQRAELEAWTKAHMPAHISVHWFGQVSRAEVDALLASISVLCVPSIVWENCPGVLREAARIGTPVLGSDAGGIRELLAPESCVKVGDIEAWTRAIGEWEKASPPLSQEERTVEEWAKSLIY